MILGKRFLLCAVRGLVAGMKAIPGLGAVIDMGDAIVLELRREQDQHALDERLQQIEEAAGISPEDARAIAREEFARLAREGIVPADDPELLRKQEAVEDIVAFMPGTIAQETRATLKRARSRGTALVTVLPIDVTLFPEAQCDAFLRSLVPLRRPKYSSGQPVPHRGGWRFDELLGVGGFGEVWRVSDLLRHTEAVKFCLEASAASVMQREADNLRLIHERLSQHPNIVAVTGINLDFDPYWLAFEYIPGGTLDAVIRSHGGPLPFDEAMRLFCGICNGMAAAHDINLIHRDLKPVNILIAEDGSPKIADFGLGKAQSEQAQRSLGTSQRHSLLAGAGTFGYMSREQREGISASPADDVYALGVILHQLLVGDAAAAIDYARDDLEDLPLPPPEEVVDLVLDCLRPRSKRPEHAGQLRKRLLAYLPATANSRPKPIEETGSTTIDITNLDDAALLRRLREDVAKAKGEVPTEGGEFFAYLAQINDLPYAKGFGTSEIKDRLTAAIQSWREEQAQQAKEQEEESRWTIARTEDTIESYATYLADTELGTHCRAAEDRKTELERLKRERESLEESMWQAATATHTVDSYEDYLRRSQLRWHVEDAEERLAERNDTRAWEEAKTADTVEAFEAYLAGTQPRAYDDQAEKEIARLKREYDDGAWVNAQADDTMEAYETYLHKPQPRRYDAKAQSAIDRLKLAADDQAWEHTRRTNSIQAFEIYLRRPEPRQHEAAAKEGIQKIRYAKALADLADAEATDTIQAWQDWLEKHGDTPYRDQGEKGLARDERRRRRRRNRRRMQAMAATLLVIAIGLGIYLGIVVPIQNAAADRAALDDAIAFAQDATRPWETRLAVLDDYLAGDHTFGPIRHRTEAETARIDLLAAWDRDTFENARSVAQDDRRDMEDRLAALMDYVNGSHPFGPIRHNADVEEVFGRLEGEASSGFTGDARQTFIEMAWEKRLQVLSLPDSQRSAFLELPDSQRSAFLELPDSQRSAFLELPDSQRSAFLELPDSQRSAFLELPDSQRSAFLGLSAERREVVTGLLRHQRVPYLTSVEDADALISRTSRATEESAGALKAQVETFLRQHPEHRSTMEAPQERLDGLVRARTQRLDGEFDSLERDAQRARTADAARDVLPRLEAFVDEHPSYESRLRSHIERLRDLVPPVVDGFTWLREETFSCGGQLHTVQIYRCEAFARALGLRGNQTDIACEFVLIPQGSFTMGSNDGDSDERPPHRVTVPAFLLARTEVTQAVWDGVARTTGSDLEDDRNWRGDRLPIEGVLWNDIQRFESATGLRLPSEAEWEYACRAGTTTRFSFGDTDSDLSDYGWYSSNSRRRTHEVAGEGKLPNAFGLFDMHGNVWEWCQDKWHDNYNGAPDDGRAWESGTSSDRILRGGSWIDFAWDCQSASRVDWSPGLRFSWIGFRPARSCP